MELNKASLDAWITREPDNGYQEWYEKVFDLIPETEISGDEYDQNEQFFDDGMQKLSQAGSHGFVNTQFAADVIKRRFRVLKENPDLKTWEDVQTFVNKRSY